MASTPGSAPLPGPSRAQKVRLASPHLPAPRGTRGWPPEGCRPGRCLPLGVAADRVPSDSSPPEAATRSLRQGLGSSFERRRCRDGPGSSASCQTPSDDSEVCSRATVNGARHALPWFLIGYVTLPGQKPVPDLSPSFGSPRGLESPIYPCLQLEPTGSSEFIVAGARVVRRVGVQPRRGSTPRGPP
jgi:hypothetical protein